MTQQEIIEMARQAGLAHFYDSEGHCTGITDANLVTADKEKNDVRLVEMLMPFVKLMEANKQTQIETLYAMYEQASRQRDEVIKQQREMLLQLIKANEIIFKSCVNLPHWKRTAMRYLKRNVPQAHQQAVDDFNEHPDGRGKQ